MAVLVCDRRLVFLLLRFLDAGDHAVACAAGSGDDLSCSQLDRCLELEVHITGVADPGGCRETDLPDRQKPSGAAAAPALPLAGDRVRTAHAAGLARWGQAADAGDDPLRRKYP